MNGKQEYGDYQTPEKFSQSVCDYLKRNRKIRPSLIIEPTCGKGSFIRNSLIFNAQNIIGIEINSNYCMFCKESINDPRVSIINADFFSFDLNSALNGEENVLVLGNPPWVTNSTLSSLNSENLPKKANYKKLKGLDALTGSSNFDICEYIILQIVMSLYRTNATIAMLCKTSVARNIFAEMRRTNLVFHKFDILEFSANKIFGVNVSACLLVIEFSDKKEPSESCGVFSFDEPNKLIGEIVYENGGLSNRLLTNKYDFSGRSCFGWRQGVKHDCSKIMELSLHNGNLSNGLNERVDIEDKLLFPLVKSSMFKSPIIDSFDKFVIVTQKKVRDDTAFIEKDAPKTWAYLTSHMDFFSKRKSSIYRNSPDFSMFGVGEYSYMTYKVGLSGFCKKPLFSLIYSNDGKPVMLDDTSYFITFPTYDIAYVAMLILNSRYVQNYLLNIAFLDSKRPFTKKLLDRIDFSKILQVLQADDLLQTQKELGLKHYFEENMLESFRNLPEFGQFRLPIYA